MVRTQAEAGKVLDKNTKDLFNEFFDDAKKIVKKTLNEIGKRERDNTRDRLRGGDTLARLVGKSKRGVDWRIKMSGNKNDYGTIEFGNILGPVQESPFVARRASKLDNIAAVLEFGASNFAPIGSGPDGTTKEQEARGFVFGNNIKNIKPYDFSKVLKIGVVMPDIPPNTDYLETAQENILEQMELRIPAALDKAFRNTDKPNRGKTR